MNQSIIANFRQQQAIEEESARLGLYGPAIMANHEAIIARMEQGADILFQLFRAGREKEAYALWNAGILE